MKARCLWRHFFWRTRTWKHPMLYAGCSILTGWLGICSKLITNCSEQGSAFDSEGAGICQGVGENWRQRTNSLMAMRNRYFANDGVPVLGRAIKLQTQVIIIDFIDPQP